MVKANCSNSKEKSWICLQFSILLVPVLFPWKGNLTIRKKKSFYGCSNQAYVTGKTVYYHLKKVCFCVSFSDSTLPVTGYS